MTQMPRTAAAFDDLIVALTEIRDGYITNEERFTDPLDVVEAYRYVGQVLAGASEMFFEGDPDFPHFVSIVTPERKLQGDNPDAIYHFSRIRGGRRYRVTGTIDRECYVSFTIHGAADDGGMAGPLLGDMNDRALTVADDGTWELVLSADATDGEGAADWMELHPDAHAIIVRSYYELPVSAQNDPDVQPRLDIRGLPNRGDAAPAPDAPPPLDDEALGTRMEEGVAFLRQATLGQGLPGRPSPVPFVSNVPNELPEPFSFRDTGLPVPGAADIVYAMCRFDLGPDDALVMTGTLPAGAFSNVMLWNRHMQTLEYRDRRSSLNGAQIELEDDGTYRIVIADRDPGVANWIDTCGHRQGSVFWRFLLPEEDPPKPVCTVVPIDSLS